MENDGKDTGWDDRWQKIKHRSKATQVAEFNMAIAFTCTHKKKIFHYKA